jgi:ribosome-associated translation inhibitor RaiA
MVLNVACRDSELSVYDRRWVGEFSLRLERYFTDILTVEWDLTQEGNGHVAVCRVHTRQGFYRANASAKSARQAMHTAIDKLIQQRHRDKKMAGSARREPRGAPVTLPPRPAHAPGLHR